MKETIIMNALKVLTLAICIKDGRFLMLNQFRFWLYSKRLRNETYRKVLQIHVMKNYAVLVKCLLRDYFCSVSIML